MIWVWAFWRMRGVVTIHPYLLMDKLEVEKVGLL